MKNKKFINLFPLETERLIIKFTTLNDVSLLLKMDKQKMTQLYLGGVRNKTKEERLIFLENKISKFKEENCASLTIFLKNNTPIGFIDLCINENNNAKISYIFDYDYCNKGYCTEACRKLLYIGFNILKLNKIFADVVQENKSSKRVLEKLGFKLKNIHINNNIGFLDYEISLEEYINT